jgi:hypothetical protein
LNAEFNWWLLIVGLVLGAGLTWLVMAESTRRDIDVTEAEQRSESAWIAKILTGSGRAAEPERVEEILRLHREYLAAPPPDEPPPASRPRGNRPDAERDSAQPEAAVADLDEA